MIQADLSRILIIKPSSLGDVAQALPVAWALRALRPRSRIDWLVIPSCAGIPDGLEAIDNVVLFDRKLFGRMWRSGRALAAFVGFVRRLRATRYTTVIDLQGLLRSGIISRLSGAETRIGLGDNREGAGRFYTHTVPVPPGEMSSVDRYMLAAEALGAPVGAPRRFDLPIADDNRLAATRLLSAHGRPAFQPYVVLVPGARWPTKRWPAEKWAALIRRIRVDLDLVPVVVGGPDERGTIERIVQLDCGPLVDLVGRTDLKTLCAVLQEAQATVTNDTGPMHLASAAGCPVVAIFGPTSVRRTGPYGAGHVLLEGRAECAPCFQRQCRWADSKQEMQCLLNIGVDEAFSGLRRLVEAGR